MLSQENIDKLHIDGIYRCNPVLSWLPSYKRDDPYWCRNWTFKVKQYDGKYYMYDTYWSTGDDYPVELTNENFDKFEYLFNLDDVRCVYYEDWIEYPEEDKWRVALGSGGITHAKYVVRKGVKKVKRRVVERLKREIDYLKHDLRQKEWVLKGIMDGSVNWDNY